MRDIHGPNKSFFQPLSNFFSEIQIFWGMFNDQIDKLSKPFQCNLLNIQNLSNSRRIFTFQTAESFWSFIVKIDVPCGSIFAASWKFLAKIWKFLIFSSEDLIELSVPVEPFLAARNPDRIIFLTGKSDLLPRQIWKTPKAEKTN